MAIEIEKKKLILEEYFKNGSIRKTALKFNIHYLTLWKWLKDYKRYGEKIFEIKKEKRGRRNKLTENIIRKIYFFKEKYPNATLKECQNFLSKKNIKVGIKTIWEIWKNAGLWDNTEGESLYSPLVNKCPENQKIIEEAKKFFQEGNIKKSAKLINSLIGYPLDPFIKNIPDKFLSPKRRFDKIYLMFGETPINEQLKNIRKLKFFFQTHGYIYTYVKISLYELMLLSWVHDPEKEMEILKSIKKYVKKIRNSSIKFLFNFHYGITYAYLLKINKARKCYKICKKIAYIKNDSKYWNIMGSFASFLGEYKKSFYFYNKAFIKEAIPKYKNYWKLRMASCLTHMGDFNQALKILKETEIKPAIFDIHSKIIEAMCEFGKGKFEKTIRILEEIVEKAKRESLKNYVHTISLIMASINKFLGREKEAKKFILKDIYLLKKYRMKRDLIIREFLLKGDKKRKIIKKEMLGFPLIRLIYYLKKSEKSTTFYYKALNFAKNKGILNDFYKFIPFFPESVERLIQKNKKTYLPKYFINLPVFVKKTLKFEINILDKFKIKREGKIIKEKFYPQEIALITYLAINYKEGQIQLSKIYENFWEFDKNGYKNLKSLIYSLRKKLKIPSDFLTIRSYKDQKYLIIRRINFSTDYEQFKNHILRAKILEKLGKNEKAILEYKNAFYIFKKMPFEKCYSRFCEDFRTQLLMEIYENSQNFLKLLKEKNKEEIINEFINKFSYLIPIKE